MDKHIQTGKQAITPYYSSAQITHHVMNDLATARHQQISLTHPQVGLLQTDLVDGPELQ